MVEVSYSQPPADLRRLARSYIVGSRNAVRCVIGLDLQYPNLSGARVYVWRAHTRMNEHNTKAEFRRAGRTRCFGAVYLHIEDILPRRVLRDSCVDLTNLPPIEISVETLDLLLSTAEARNMASPSCSPPCSQPLRRSPRNHRTRDPLSCTAQTQAACAKAKRRSTLKMQRSARRCNDRLLAEAQRMVMAAA